MGLEKIRGWEWGGGGQHPPPPVLVGVWGMEGWGVSGGRPRGGNNVEIKSWGDSRQPGASLGFVSVPTEVTGVPTAGGTVTALCPSRRAPGSSASPVQPPVPPAPPRRGGAPKSNVRPGSEMERCEGLRREVSASPAPPNPSLCACVCPLPGTSSPFWGDLWLLCGGCNVTITCRGARRGGQGKPFLGWLMVLFF